MNGASAPDLGPVEPDEQVGPDGLTAEERSANRLAWRLLLPLTLLLVTLFLVFFVIFDHSVVSGPSMIPTLMNGDYILITKGLAVPRRGDVVVLDVLEKGKPTEWVKRIVALGGDRVHISGDTVLVNGIPESFAHGVVLGSEPGVNGDVVVPAGDIFVMGDNRPVSLDSRYVGPMPVGAIIGKAVAIYAPVTRIGRIPGP